jgi:phosphopantetheine adenylyltransferase
MFKFENLLRLASFLLAAYFFYVFHLRQGLPATEDLDSTSIIFLALSVIFTLLPLAKKITIGKLFEYEAKVREIKEEVKEFKEETRNLLTIYNNLTNAISNTVTQSIVVNLPGIEELEGAREKLDNTIEKGNEPFNIDQKVSNYLASGEYDQNLALARLRMDIERELRRILGKNLESNKPLEMKSRFLSARSLFSEFLKKNPKYEDMYSSFDYILKICNAAVHGQVVPEGYGREALYMGIKILEELSSIRQQPD